MLPVSDFRQLRVLVLGLGLLGGGESVVRWCVARGAQVLATDARGADVLRPTLQALRRFSVRYVLGRHRRRDVEWADLIVKNPGVPNDHPLVRYAQRLGRPIENETALFFASCPAPIVGVTGTKGKSTSAALTYAFLRRHFVRAAYGGNYGTPALDLLPRCRPDHPAVIELSSWQIEGLLTHRQSPHIAVVLNVLPDHLNRYRSFAQYAATKRSLTAFLGPGDVGVLNADDVECRRVRVPVGAVARWFSTRSTNADAFLHGQFLYLRHGRRVNRFASLADLPNGGRHFVSNVLAAGLAAQAAGAPWRTFARCLRGFRQLSGRQELIRTVRGVAWINDTTATAPSATIVALRSFAQRPIILIVGGVDKHLPYTPLAAEIQCRVKAVVLLPGSASVKILRALRGEVPTTHAATMHAAVSAAARLARRGDAVILSPAAASFNLFRNEFDRGAQFQQAVAAL